MKKTKIIKKPAAEGRKRVDKKRALVIDDDNDIASI